MWPPFETIAARLRSSPAAIGGMPAMRKLRAAPRAKRPNEQSQRTIPMRSDVRHGSVLNGKATNWSTIAT